MGLESAFFGLGGAELSAALTGVGLQYGLGMGEEGGEGQSIGEQITAMVNMQNDILNDYMNKAINTSTQYSGEAINEQRSGLNSANNYLMQYLDKASNAAQTQSLLGNMQSMGLAQAYLNSGGQATDSLMSSLGMPVPIVGTAALQAALSKQGTSKQAIELATQQALQKYGLNGSAPTNPTSPTAPSRNAADYMSSITPQQIAGWLNPNFRPDNSGRIIFTDPVGGTSMATGNYFSGGVDLGALTQALNDPNFVNTAAPGTWQVEYYNMVNNLAGLGRTRTAEQAAANAWNTYNSQLASYNTDLSKYTGYTDAINSAKASNALSPMDLSILDAYNKGFFNTSNS